MVDFLGLERPLVHTLSTTHAIRQARFRLCRQICRPPTWQDTEMALHWSTVSFADSVEQRRRVPGFWQLRGLAWVLERLKTAGVAATFGN